MDPLAHDISVRDLEQFVHRRGDLGGEIAFRRSTPLVEEIKTVEPGRSCVLAQLRIYAAIVALEIAWSYASLQLTYLELDANEVFLFREETSREVLIEFLKGGAVRAAFGTFDYFLYAKDPKRGLEVIDVDYCKRLERERGAKPSSRPITSAD
jgi:hypothetical protein